MRIDVSRLQVPTVEPRVEGGEGSTIAPRELWEYPLAVGIVMLVVLVGVVAAGALTAVLAWVLAQGTIVALAAWPLSIVAAAAIPLLVVRVVGLALKVVL